MQNILTAAMHAMKSLINPQHPTPPLHIGKAMAFWTYLTALEEINAYEDAALNTTEDQELRNELLSAQEICRSHIKHVQSFMISEGIPMPSVSGSKPKSDPHAIPMGVKATDEEIANGLVIKAAGAIIHCASSMSQSVRTDVAIMWTRFQAENMTYAVTLKTLMIKRNWLKHPPAYLPPGHPAPSGNS